jgi:hypothetical protein
MPLKEDKIEYWRSQRPLLKESLGSPYHARFFVSEWMYTGEEFNSIQEVVDWIQKNITYKWRDVFIEKWENGKWINVFEVYPNERVKREKSKGLFVLEDFIDDEPVTILIQKSQL